MKIKFDIKNVMIVILSLIVILTILFHRSSVKKIQKNNVFEKENKVLRAQIFYLNKMNKINEEKINKLNFQADSLMIKLSQNELEIKKLIKKRNEIPKSVNDLSANDVASALSDYIERASR